MKDYSDGAVQDIKDRVSAWMDEFEESQEYLSLSADQKEESSFAIGVFADLMYGYHLETPEEWSEGALRDCCLALLPRKVLAGPEFYGAVEPVLTTFFAFLQRTGRINNAAELTNELKQVAGTMIEDAEDPESWGWAEALLGQAVEDGVDVANEEKMYEYLQVLTEQAGGETGSSRSLGSKKRKRTPKRTPKRNGGE
jgi:hypothetical protein